jgi:hypothetical protein
MRRRDAGQGRGGETHVRVKEERRWLGQKRRDTRLGTGGKMHIRAEEERRSQGGVGETNIRGDEETNVREEEERRIPEKNACKRTRREIQSTRRYARQGGGEKTLV